MTKRLILIILFPVIGVLATQFALNLYRVTQYEKRVAHILSLNPENWYLPKQIPHSATKVFYDYSETWGQGSGTDTLRFRLPQQEADTLALEITKQYFNTEKSTSPLPPIAENNDYRALVWSHSKGKHAAQGGIWYSHKNQEFLFFHENE